MRTYPNVEKISRIRFSHNAVVYCPLGCNQNMVRVVCDIQPKDRYVDELDLQDYFEHELNGQELTDEGLCAEVFSTMKREYGEGAHICIAVHNETHLSIDVIKEG